MKNAFLSIVGLVVLSLVGLWLKAKLFGGKVVNAEKVEAE